MLFEMVVTAHVDQGRGSGLCGGASLPAVSEDFRSQFEPLIEFFLYQPAGVWKVAEPGLRHHLIAGTAVESPFAHVLLQPDGQLVPNLSNAQALVGIARGDFEHREATDLRNVF